MSSNDQTTRVKATGWKRVKKWAIWGGGGFIAVLAVVTAGLALTFTATDLDLPDVELGRLPIASPPSNMSISALPTGYYESREALAYRGGSWGEIRKMAMTAILIRHPDGNLLIDAGAGINLDEDVLTVPKFQRTPHTQGTPAVIQLAEHGIAPSDISGIILTHAHWDHTSGVRDFVSVPVLESVAGKAFLETGREDAALLNSFAGVQYEIYDFDAGPYLGFESSHDVYGDGAIVIVPAPGHTPDSVIVFVTLPSQSRYAFIGDLTFLSEGVTLPADKPWLLRLAIGEDDAQIHQGIAILRTLSAQDANFHVVPSHDMPASNRIPAFPDVAE